MHVLVVDDDAVGRDLRRMVLEQRGHHVATAADTVAARACLGEASPDAVLMDLRLPHAEDGLALLRFLHETAPAVRVVVLSGFEEDLGGRVERGFASAVLSKPVRTERLIEALGMNRT